MSEVRQLEILRKNPLLPQRRKSLQNNLSFTSPKLSEGCGKTPPLHLIAYLSNAIFSGEDFDLENFGQESAINYVGAPLWFRF